MEEAIDQFLGDWSFVRGTMTRDFMKAVPDAHWECAPYAGAQPLHKQFRHMIWCSGVYNEALRTRSADWTRKRTHYAGGLGRAELLAALDATDDDLRRTLRDLRTNDLATWRVDFMGHSFGFHSYTSVLIQHESIHHGIWSTYARLAGFDSPESWQLNWAL